MKLDVPFLIDDFECTPLDQALGISDVVKSDDNFIDTELASVYLKNLKDQPFLNFGNLFVRSIKECVV